MLLWSGQALRPPADVDGPASSSIVPHRLNAPGGLNQRPPGMQRRASHACRHSTLRVDRPEPQGRSPREGRREAAAGTEELPGFSGYSLIDAGNGVMTSRRLLRDRGAGRRVGPRRRQLAARAEARDRAPEPAQDHQRQRRRPQDRRARPGLTAPSSSVARRRPAQRAFSALTGTAQPRPPSIGREGASDDVEARTHRSTGTVGHISRPAQVRIDQRVKEILARDRAAGRHPLRRADALAAIP